MAQDSRLVNVWNGMRQRCNNPNTVNYPRYGGRGITVCERWGKFNNFYEDMGLSYEPGLTLDRIDNSLGYTPENCRWVTAKQNNNNKRNNRLVTINGETKTLTQWCESLGLRRGTVNQRISVCGWSVDRALTTPIRRRKQ